jgi:hypothetical protein
MAEDKTEPREINWRQLLPWTALFQGFRVARDPNKLILAAAGILAMACAWWVLAVIFNYQRPQWEGTYLARYSNDRKKAWDNFKADRRHWDLMHRMAGAREDEPQNQPRLDSGDLATSPDEKTLIDAELDSIRKDLAKGTTEEQVRLEAGKRTVKRKDEDGKLVDAPVSRDVTLKALQLVNPPIKPFGAMRTWPWVENRGSNPFLLVTGQAGRTLPDGTTRSVPWEKGHFIEWMLTEQGPVLIEPLIKLLEPIIFFFNPQAGLWSRTYCLLVMLATLAIWGLFGGAITRIAAVQVARQEKIGIKEALVFTARRYLSYLAAPLFPILLVALIVVVMLIFSVFHLIPFVGDIIVDGLLWWVVVLLGLAMAIILIGLVGWPLMASTISAEGTDFWEAVSRSYSYVFGAPWHYAFYSVIALVYGAVLVFFVGFVGSATVYFAKWGVAQIGPASRDPATLFMYAPTSFEWRTLLTQGGSVDGEPLLTRDGKINEDAYQKIPFYREWGAVMVAFWLGVIFLFVLGFGYSYFWSASTIIYLLMRRKVDDTETDEVYLEEEDQDTLYGAVPSPPKAAAPAPPPAPLGGGMTMVDSPTLRVSPPAAPPAPKEPTVAESPPPPAPTPPAPSGGDGNPPPGG